MPDAAELALHRRARGTAGLALFDAVDESEATGRHALAIQSVEDSATAREDALVADIQAMLRTRFRFTADDVAELLDAAGVASEGPGALGIRRRVASRCINGGRGKWWNPDGTTMTTLARRSGRPVTVWQVIQFPAADP